MTPTLALVTTLTLTPEWPPALTLKNIAILHLYSAFDLQELVVNVVAK